METILRIIAGLSFLAFVVGMINPAAVKCKSKDRVALLYLGVFIVCVFVGAAIMEDNSSIEKPSKKYPPACHAAATRKLTVKPRVKLLLNMFSVERNYEISCDPQGVAADYTE